MKFDFKMSGGLGDIVFAVPAMRELGGGSLCICPSKYTDNALHSHSGNVNPTAESMVGLAALLTETTAGVVSRVVVCDEEQEARYDLNEFREWPNLFGPPTIPEMILRSQHCDPAGARQQWLFVKEPAELDCLVIHRTERYHTPSFPWPEIVSRYTPRVYFVGSQSEHCRFCDENGYVPWRSTRNLLELAQTIAGARLFASNQSVGYAIAEGLKRQAMLELWCPNNNFDRAEVLLNPSPEDQFPPL